jgi:AcrR family transcriptional regulator
MRTQDSHIAADVLPEAVAGDPATGPAAGQGSAGGAPNVRVAPARGPARGPVGGWDCDVAPDTGDAENVHDTDTDTDAHEHEHRDAARRPGRPRSERAEQAILDAAIEAVGECGIDGVRCEDVAARAGVGKATLYRRWPGKEDLLIAAFAAMKRPVPELKGASVRADLVALLTVMADDADDPRYAQHYALLHGAGERYPRLVARYKQLIVEPRRELVRSVLRRGIEAGELRPGTDVEVAMLMLTGAVMARGKHDSTPDEPRFVDRAVDELLHGIASR